jgi:hypothetical protein
LNTFLRKICVAQGVADATVALFKSEAPLDSPFCSIRNAFADVAHQDFLLIS